VPLLGSAVSCPHVPVSGMSRLDDSATAIQTGARCVCALDRITLLVVKPSESFEAYKYNPSLLQMLRLPRIFLPFHLWAASQPSERAPSHGSAY